MDNIWVATSYGALDVSNLAFGANAGIECLVLPAIPGEPVGLTGDVAALWRRLVVGPISEDDLTAEQLALVREFDEFGLASTDLQHPSRITTLPEPWLNSPLHELVYSLVARLARERGVGFVFIKGPALHRQGLRDRQDSGDVDVWVETAGIDALQEALEEWGWTELSTIWNRRPPSHSVTMRPGSWGCEIDMHHSFPGIGVSSAEAFVILSEDAVEVDYAGTTAYLPYPAAHAVIAALHTARPEPGRPASSSPEAAETLRRAGPATIEIAQRLHADAALAPVLKDVFGDDFTAPKYQAPLNWRWREQPSSARSYLMVLRLMPITARPRFAFRILWPTREMALASDARAGGHARTVLGARMRRLRRGFGMSSVSARQGTNCAVSSALK